MKVIMPGSYDPVTVGHLDVIKRVAAKEEQVYVCVFVNPDKTYRFSLEDRVRMLMLATEGLDNVLVSYSLGRVIDYMREHGIEKIVKGYRNCVDLEYEKKQADYNLKHGGFETELIKCEDNFRDVSSTEARRRIDTSESLDGILPPSVESYIRLIKN